MSVINDIDLTPITRLEYDIDAIINDHSVIDPVTRIEQMLSDIKDGTPTAVEPVTRIETFLANISGVDIALPEPVTRIETFLAIIAGGDYEAPEPATRLEGLLAEWVEKGSGIWKTVTGTLIHITDALASPMRKCEVSLEPIQDLHGQDAPYPAGGGVNKLDESAYTSLSQVTYSNGVFTSTDLPGNRKGTGAVVRTFLNGTQVNTYVVAFSSLNNGDRAEFEVPFDGTFDSFDVGYRMNSSFNDAARFSASGIANGTYTISFYCDVVPKTTATRGEFSRIQLELGSSATPYKPYANICPITGWTGCEVWVKDEYDTTLPSTASVTFPDSAGTVYGGTVDLVSGELAVTWVSADISKFFWGYVSALNTFRTNELKNIIKPPSSNTKMVNAICSTFKIVSAGSVSTTNLSIGCNTEGVLVLRYDAANGDRETLVELLTGVQFVYELATPITYQLTPQEISTLAGENNVWGDGDIELTYKAQAE